MLLLISREYLRSLFVELDRVLSLDLKGTLVFPSAFQGQLPTQSDHCVDIQVTSNKATLHYPLPTRNHLCEFHSERPRKPFKSG